MSEADCELVHISSNSDNQDVREHDTRTRVTWPEGCKWSMHATLFADAAVEGRGCLLRRQGSRRR